MGEDSANPARAQSGIAGPSKHSNTLKRAGSETLRNDTGGDTKRPKKSTMEPPAIPLSICKHHQRLLGVSADCGWRTFLAATLKRNLGKTFRTPFKTPGPALSTAGADASVARVVQRRYPPTKQSSLEKIANDNTASAKGKEREVAQDDDSDDFYWREAHDGGKEVSPDSEVEPQERPCEISFHVPYFLDPSAVLTQYSITHFRPRNRRRA